WRWGLAMWTPISGIPELVRAIRRPVHDSGAHALDSYQLAPLERRRLTGSGARGSGVADWAKLMTVPGSNMEPPRALLRPPAPTAIAPVVAHAEYRHHE